MLVFLDLNPDGQWALGFGLPLAKKIVSLAVPHDRPQLREAV